MRTHPRVAIVTQARAALTEAVARWDREHAPDDPDKPGGLE